MLSIPPLIERHQPSSKRRDAAAEGLGFEVVAEGELYVRAGWRVTRKGGKRSWTRGRKSQTGRRWEEKRWQRERDAC